RTPPLILRPGMISRADLEAATGITWQREIARTTLTETAAESPGQHLRHYAPCTPFYVLDAGVDPPSGRGRIIELPPDRDSYAHRLYAELHRADKEGWDWIAVLRPPDTAEWMGILDRLRRAAYATAENQAMTRSNALL